MNLAAHNDNPARKSVIKGKIGTDPEELSRIADAVVDRGESIKDMEIADLRALIEAVQQHSRAKLAPPWTEGNPAPDWEAIASVTSLEIVGGTIIVADCMDLNIRVSLVVQCHFSGPVDFREARFAGHASFKNANFAQETEFGMANFGGHAIFTQASFEEGAWFNGTNFAELAMYTNAHFAKIAWFDDAYFAVDAVFNGVCFAGLAKFDEAIFARGAGFADASFAEEVWFEGVCFAKEVRFDGASFAGHVGGDLRTCTVREAEAALAQTVARFRPATRSWRPLLRRLPTAVWSWLACAWFGWGVVRSLGSLHILNRLSLVILIAVPVLASAYVVLRKAIGENPDGRTPSVLVQILVGVFGDDPYLSLTLAMTFLAAVAITIGLLIYQVFAPETIKKVGEDEHVREVEARYPERSAQRNDGLRRAIERLEDQAIRRLDRHPSFVKHHGDLIWIPPRHKIEWFNDATLPKVVDHRKQVDRVFNATGASVATPDPIDARQREGFVTGAERARICIEEGARAEYWLLSHQKIAAAWVSFLLYMTGIVLLMCILYIQCDRVGRAAGLWGTSPVAKAITPPDPPP